MISNSNNKVPSLGWIEPVSKLLDSSFRIPGTNFKFGLDPIIGSIPVLGDLVTFGISAMLFLNMSKHGASRKVVVLMATNIIIDFAIGSIPFVGWLFDFGFKANDKNVRLLKEHYIEGKHQGSGSGILFLIFIVLIGVLGLVVFGVFKLILYIKAYFDTTGGLAT